MKTKCVICGKFKVNEKAKIHICNECKKSLEVLRSQVIVV